MFGNNSDWIEIANTGAIAAQLDGWYLTDRMANLKWRFPEKLLAPGEYLVVFASGYYETGDELHADFKLTSSGEYLGLIAPDGVTVVSEFAPTYGQQVPDVSYGRDDAGQLLFYTQPTPGAPKRRWRRTSPIQSGHHGIHGRKSRHHRRRGRRLSGLD